MPLMTSSIVKQSWSYAWLNIVLGKEGYQAIQNFGHQFGFGEPWRVRFFGMVAEQIRERGDEIARELVAHNLTTVPRLLIPDVKVATLTPKVKKIVRKKQVRDLSPKLEQILRIFMPLAIYRDVIAPVLTVEEQTQWANRLEEIESSNEKEPSQVSDQLTTAIAELLELIRKRHGDDYETLIEETQAQASQEILDFMSGAITDYKHLAKQKFGKKYGKLVATQDIVGLTKAYLEIK